MAALNCYGENSFTFLLFQYLMAGSPSGERARDFFLTRLQPFDATRQHATDELSKVPPEAIETWLFPNFGKAFGFGEPDALILAGNFTFWIESETHINFKRRRTAARNSLRQLLRFNMLANALSGADATTRDRHLEVVGWTFDGTGQPREAVLRIAGHKPLASVRARIRQSVENRQDHYVLVSERSPAYVSTHGLGLLTDVIDAHYQELRRERNAVQPLRWPTPNQFWYAYWRGHLSAAFKKSGLNDPLSAGGYCGIKG